FFPAGQVVERGERRRVGAGNDDLADRPLAFVDGGEHKLKNVSRPVHIFHVRNLAAPALTTQDAAKTTTRIVPQVVLRFEGANTAGQKFGFDVAIDKLMQLPQGMMIGRAADQCELVLAHATVSRRHARLVLTGEALKIEDQGSTNGTSVNGTDLKSGAPAVIRPGDKIRIGDIELGVKHL
ncbi:MAG: FHA domain-containing protein, partial [Enhydrobacter sp.]